MRKWAFIKFIVSEINLDSGNSKHTKHFNFWGEEKNRDNLICWSGEIKKTKIFVQLSIFFARLQININNVGVGCKY